jgi:uncharacterized protein YoxC
MQENNLDINLVIQTFQEKVNQLMNDLIIKEATIKQLLAQIQHLQVSQDDFINPEKLEKKAK